MLYYSQKGVLMVGAFFEPLSVHPKSRRLILKSLSERDKGGLELTVCCTAAAKSHFQCFLFS